MSAYNLLTKTDGYVGLALLYFSREDDSKGACFEDHERQSLKFNLWSDFFLGRIKRRALVT